MKNWFYVYLQFIIQICAMVWLTSCIDEPEPSDSNIRIGVSQCSGGDWRDKMNDEMRREAIFHPGITFDFCNANDDPQKQLRDVDSLIQAGVDLLVVAPIDSILGTELVAKAHAHQLPVIVADRQITNSDYTAFVGGDNYKVGLQAAQYLSTQLPQGGEVLEIRGHDGSTPVERRHQGFVDGLAKHPELKLVASVDGWWMRDSAKICMEDAIHAHPNLQAVFCHNDYMAMGAYEMFGWVRKSQIEHGETVPEGRPLFIGVDAVYGRYHGLAWVEEGRLDASILYPTGGDVIVKTAVEIMNNRPYVRDSVLSTFVVDAKGATLLNNMDLAVIQEVDKVHWLQGREMQLLKRINVEQWLLVVSGAFILFIIVAMLQMRRHYLERRRTALRLVRANRQLRDAANLKLQELQRQTTNSADEQVSDRIPESAPSLQPLPKINPFIERVYEIIDQHYSEADFGVEHLSVLLDMSRSQLYRKVKSLTGVTPFDMIRDKRFCEAERLLAEGLNYEQIATRVGFTSAIYFERCFEDYRNMSSQAD